MKRVSLRPSLYINFCIVRNSSGTWIFEAPTGATPSWHWTTSAPTPPDTYATGHQAW